MNVYCTNPDCPEFEIAKGNPMEYPPEVISCGGCGLPVAEVLLEVNPGDKVPPEARKE
jgi:hypothetical protein